MVHIAAVVLAAGCSSRFPANKLLQPLGGKSIVRHVVEAALASHASPVIVVTGYNGKAVRTSLAGLPIETVDNLEFSTGLSSSLKRGLRATPEYCGGSLVFLGDMPFVSPEIADQLMAAFNPAAGRAICVPTRSGRRGHPVLWGRQFFPEIAGLSGDKGAKQLMALHPDLLYELEVGEDGVLVDIDTPEDLARHDE